MSAVDDAKAQLEKAEAEANAKRLELERVEKLTALYPDLERYEGRWKRIVYSSALVNEQATDVFFRFNCGCCGDSPLEAWPYVKTEHGDVYTSPAYFSVGEKHWISGAKPDAQWEATLRQAKLSEAVIERVRERFAYDRTERIAIATEEGTVSDDPDPYV